MQIFEKLLESLINLANHIPIEIYSIIGPFIEEIVSPIPSPLVMASAGSIAAAQNKTWVYLVYLALLGSIGKTIASWILYFIADKFEDLALSKFGKFVGITHKEVEKIGSYFNGTKKDFLVILLSRAIPIIPSSPISIVSGIVKIKISTYLTGTFLGTIIRNMFYLYFGFAGLNAYKQTLEGLDSLESIMQILIAFALLALMVWLFIQKRKGKGIEALNLNKKEDTKEEK
jgi:membrane protein DedA with SNARE-associated domain